MRDVSAATTGQSEVALPQDILSKLLFVQQNTRLRSVISWGEHCTECAFPTCYASCEYYTPRPSDLNCRRFVHGIEQLRVTSSSVQLMRIAPRKWAKLEGKRPVGLMDASRASRWELANEAVSAAYRSPLLGRGLKERLVCHWDTRKATLGALSPLAEAEGFLIETVLLDGGPKLPMTISIVPKAQDKGLFQFGFCIQTGYARTFVPLDRISAAIDLNEAFLVQIEPVDQAFGRSLIFGTADFVSSQNNAFAHREPGTAHARDQTKPKAKCVIWDLDNTVWDGTLAEDGADALTLRAEVVRVIKELDSRGILQSAVSKNDEREAFAALERFGLKEYFLYPQISWGRKSDAVRRIGEKLNIGLNTLVFIDDQPFERAEVQESVPEIDTFSESEITSMLRHERFDVPATREAGQRRLMYQQETRRSEAFREAALTDYDIFLRSCKITLGVQPLTEQDLERVYELSQRTNQLNVAGTRYDREQLREMCRDPRRLNLVFRCRDRFGEYGIIGFVAALPDESKIEAFFMSCRVQRKKVEHAILQNLIVRLGRRRHEMLRVRYQPTKRNMAALLMFEELGFAINEGDGVIHLVRSFDPVRGSDIVQVEEIREFAGAAE